MISAIRNRLLGPQGSLRRQTVVGGQWLMARSITLAIVDVVKAAVFTRLLFPEDYGLMALATMATGLMEAVSSLGIEVMVQREDDGVEARLAEYWTLRFVAGLVLAGAAWCIAPPLAAFYQKRDLIPLVRFLGFLFVVKGVGGFGIEMQQRRMAFARVAAAEVAAAVTVLTIGIGVLFWIRNVWALAIYVMLTAVARTIISYLLYPWRPHWCLSRPALRSVAVFGGSMVTVHLLNYVLNNMDRGIIGKLSGVDTLGYYARAHFLAVIPAVYAFNTISTAVLQAYRQLIGDRRRLRSWLMKVLGVFASAAIGISAVCFLMTEWIILFLYGERWLPIAPLYRILLLFGACKGIGMACSPVFLVLGRPWLIPLGSAVSVACFLVMVYPFTSAMGVRGTAWALSISGAASLVVSVAMAVWIIHRPSTGDSIGDADAP